MSSVSSNGSDASARREKKRKKKEKKKEKKRKKKEKKKEKKRRKKEKKKKTKKKKKSARPTPGACNQFEYGSRGIIRMADMYQKGPEFECWLREVKSINDCSSRDAKELFTDYMEDYNTATFPHEKYYHLERWQMQEQQKKQAKLLRAANRARGEGKGLNDEKEREQERKAARARSRRDDLHASLHAMNPAKVAEMKRQEGLMGKMQHAWKSGNAHEADRLQKLLAPDDAKEVARLERIRQHHM